MIGFVSTNARLEIVNGWYDNRFEALAASCQPREVYQLQRQITLRHGRVEGFDFVGLLDPSIQTMILKRLSFSDLASCRLVKTKTPSLPLDKPPVPPFRFSSCPIPL